MNDVKSLSHSKWRCKYHIVFAPRKQVELIEGECCPDHIHILVAIPPHLSVSQFMGYLKSKSSLMIFDRHANLKYKYGNRHFWRRGYYVDTVGKYEELLRSIFAINYKKILKWIHQISRNTQTRLRVAGKSRPKKAPEQGAACNKSVIARLLFGALFRVLPQELGPYRA